MLIRAPANMARDEYLLVPKATVDPALMEQQAKSAANDPTNPGKDVIAGWRVTAMTSSEHALIANTTFWNASRFRNEDGAATRDDPLFSLMEAVTSAGHQAVVDATIPYFSVPLSEASFVVSVCRIPSSYTYNFMILISMLEFIAFVSYVSLSRLYLPCTSPVPCPAPPPASPMHLPRTRRYLLLPSDLDPRVNLTLTVFLGVIFFQIMLSELLPTTG